MLSAFPPCVCFLFTPFYIEMESQFAPLAQPMIRLFPQLDLVLRVLGDKTMS